MALLGYSILCNLLQRRVNTKGVVLNVILDIMMYAQFISINTKLHISIDSNSFRMLEMICYLSWTNQDTNH